MSTALIRWYFYELLGLGGWVIFLILALAAVFYIFYDSSNRKLRVLGWRVGILILALLLLPTLLYRFTVNLRTWEAFMACHALPPVGAGIRAADCVNSTGLATGLFGPFPPLTPYYEIIFYMGIIGGILSVAVATAYYINFKDVRSSGRSSDRPYNPPPVWNDRRPPVDRDQTPPPVPPSPKKPKVSAWLVAQDGSSYQLCSGTTTIGRSSENDIYLSKDSTISKHQAKIVEQNNHFRLIDLGSTNGTKVNGHWLHQPVLLEPNDEVQFGDHTVMRFITSN